MQSWQDLEERAAATFPTPSSFAAVNHEND
jgi:hypothetical protein